MLAVSPIQHAPAPSRKKVVGLVRVSTAQQAGEDRGGIPRQREVIRRTIEANDLDCLRVYELVDVSGTNVREHPDIIEILRLISSGVVSALVLADLDRLFRPDQPMDYAILQVFKDSGAVIYSGDTTYDLGSKDGMLFSGIRATIAGYELALIKERLFGAKEAKRRAGQCPTNKYTLPLGVSYDRCTEKFFYNDQIGIVQELFRLVDQEGVRCYTDMERRTGVKAETIPHLLRNRLFLGERVLTEKRGPKRISRTGRTYRVKVKRADNEVIRVKVIGEPAVSPERFERVQLIVNAQRNTFHQVRERDKVCNLAVGVARCAYCGARLYCSSKRSGGKSRPSGYYYCRSNYYLFRETQGCKQPNLRKPVVDALLEAFTIHTLTNEDTLMALLADSVNRTLELKPFVDHASQKQTLEQRDRRLLDALEQGVITVDEFRERRQKIRTQLNALERANNPDQQKRKMEMEQYVAAVVHGAFAFKRLADPHEKKRVIMATFSEVFFREDSIVSFRFKNPLPGVAGPGHPIILLPEPFRIEQETEDPVPEGHKRCYTCREVLPLDQFYEKRNQCRSCISKAAHEQYLKRREKAKRLVPVAITSR